MDPVDALNRIFPDEESFNRNFDAAVKYANDCKLTLQHKLSHRPDISAQKQAAIAAPAQLQSLVKDIHKIQNLGEETLDKVKSVTHEIKRLDHAKENLTATMRMLRQLKMLTNLYVQQDSLLKERKYEDMAENVKAASDLIDYFRPFRPLPQISQISHEIVEMEAKIYNQIEADFKHALAIDSSPHDSSGPPANHAAGAAAAALPADVLRSACSVLDSLDSAHESSITKDKLLNWYCNTMLSEYWSIFRPDDEAGSLENVKRRYTYLKNKVLLRYMASHTHYFPDNWQVRPLLVQRMCERTAQDLLSLISQLSGSDGDQIQLLLSTIHESLEFEKFAKCPDLITSHLIPYLSVWVQFQDVQLHQRISNYSRMLLPPDDTDPVIPSSKELVNVYRALLTQLTKLKHEEKTVEQLAEVMANRLGQYATQVLIPYLPPTLKFAQDVLLAGKIDSTAEYIISTTMQLEKNISTQLQTPEISAEIFEKLALSRFRKVSLRVEDAMVQYMSRIFEPLWIEFANQYSAQHGKEIDVSRVSPYTARVISQIDSSLSDIFHAAPSPGMVYSVGTRVVDLVCTGFLTMAMARVSKPLSESQVEQMLLDLGAIKSQSLLRMLDRAPADIKDKKGAARLERLPQRVLDGLAQAEAVLKVLMTPTEPMETFVRNYQLLIKDRATLNFRKVLDVKGVRYQPRAIEKFKMMASQEPQLMAENPLLRQIPTVPPATQFPTFENGLPAGSASSTPNGGSGFGINNFRKIGDFLRRDHM